MGTPHYGGNSILFGQTIINLVSIFVQADSKFLKQLKEDSQLIQQQLGQYAPISGDFVTKFAYETLPTAGIRGSAMVVPHSSAVVLSDADAEPIAIHANHSNMVKFVSEEDPGYKTISGHLLIMSQSAPAKVQARWRDYEETNNVSNVGNQYYNIADKSLPNYQGEKILDSELASTLHSKSSLASLTSEERECLILLNSADLDGFVNSRDKHLAGTLGWLHECQEYIEWNQCTEPAVLWISGQPGKGKTTLASFILQLLSDHLTSDSMICKFYCSTSEIGLNTGESVVKTLIFQLVKYHRQFLRLVKSAYRYGGAQNLNRLGVLLDILQRIIRQDPQRTVYIIIDAIDECSRESQNALAEGLANLTNLRTAARIKLLFTSQLKSTALYKVKRSSKTFFECNLENYEEWIKRDIEVMVRTRIEFTVDAVASNPRIRSELAASLVAGAEATFLWVKLVLDELDERRSLSAGDIEELVTKPRGDLIDRYRSILATISPAESSRAAKILHLIASSPRAPSYIEIPILFTINSGFKDSVSLEAACELSIDMIRSLLASLVRISESKLYLFHSSLMVFLRQLTLEKGHIADTYGFHEQRASLQLCVSCMEYLLLSDFEKPWRAILNKIVVDEGSPEISPSTSLEDLFQSSMFMQEEDYEHHDLSIVPRRFGLYDYAATQWAWLLKSNQFHATDECMSIAIRLFQRDTDRTKNWFLYFCHSNDAPSPSILSPLILSSYFGLDRLLVRVIEQEIFSFDELDQSIYWASYFGHDRCLVTLLPLVERPSPHAVNLDSAILITTQAGHTGCFKALLPHCSMQLRDKSGRSFLSLAAAGAHVDLLTTILQMQGSDPNTTSNSGFPALFYAVGEAAADTTRILCDDRRVNTFYTKNGRNVVSWAAEIGDIKTMEILLQYKIDTHSADDGGLTPLMYAAMNGNFEVLKLLTASQRSQLELRDNKGRNALSYAASQKDHRIVEHLMKLNPEHACISDHAGWTPLAWSFDPPGYYKNFRLLLRYGHAEYNLKDNGGKTPFAWAVNYGYVPFIKFMLEISDLDVDTTDRDGRTPASLAASGGNIEIVELLFHRVNWRIPDRKGRVPHDWARFLGNQHILEFLERSTITEATQSFDML